MYRNCQVCGNPIFSMRDCGTDADGRINRDFCSNCYRTGHFYAKDSQRVHDSLTSAAAPLYAARSSNTGLGLNGFN